MLSVCKSPKSKKSLLIERCFKCTSNDHHLQSSQYDTSRVGSHLKRDPLSKLNYQQASGEKVLEEPSLKISLLKEGRGGYLEWEF